MSNAQDFIDQIQKKVHRRMSGVDRAFQNALPESARAAAEVFHSELLIRVPVDTGETKASIGMRQGATRKQHAQYIVYSTSPIWHIIEYGTSKWGGHPFVRPALDMTAQERKDAAIDAILTAVRIATS